MSEAFEDRIEEVAEEEDFGDSTIFSAPEEKNDRVAKPKLLRRILIGVGALLVLAGTKRPQKRNRRSRSWRRRRSHPNQRRTKSQKSHYQPREG
mgnify:CR=1 FL=1